MPTISIEGNKWAQINFEIKNSFHGRNYPRPLEVEPCAAAGAARPE